MLNIGHEFGSDLTLSHRLAQIAMDAPPSVFRNPWDLRLAGLTWIEMPLVFCREQ